MPAPVIGVDWESRLRAALGDDMALLALAKEAPSIDIKLAAVLALAGEDTLRQAEREFRTHDRRVHRAAKQRYETRVRQREMRARAEDLIRAAATLVEEPVIPANRLVELDRAWRELDAALLEDPQNARFCSLRASLAELLRGRGECKRLADRWCADARVALAHLSASCKGAATAALEPHELAAATEAARSTLDAIPASGSMTTAEASAIATLDQALRGVLRDAALLGARLEVLGELQRGTPPQKVGPEEGEHDARPAATPLQRWQALEPIADRHIRDALDARFEEWLRMQGETRRKRQADKRQCADEKDKAAFLARVRALTEEADATEAALAAGSLAEAEKHLATLQTASVKGSIGALQIRIDALQAEIARLKGWQHWGGGRARDDLVLEAEALARSVAAADGAPPARVQLGELEKSIGQLRARWKELDRLGGATSKSIWQSFDSALKTAHLPVAAHLARLSDARQENLAARENLLAAIDAIDINGNGPETATDWKEIARAFAHFQTEWRKLGPLEHTVPRKAQAALLARTKASTARLEEPLREARRGAQAEREQFIARASALGPHAQERDIAGKLRELQAQWQQHAKAQPLPRKMENALWADFRAAIEAVMSQREAAQSARNAEFGANQAARETLIARLDELAEDTAPEEIKRVMATVDAEWRKAGEAPRNQAAKLESRFRAARDTALQYVAGSAQRIWRGTCDALVAKLALCGEVESGAPDTAPDIEARWAALPMLPSRWEEALRARFDAGVEHARSGNTANCGSSVACGEALDKFLLQLELALDIPSPATCQAERRAFKLMAMKETMEGRRPTGAAAADIEKMTTAAFACTHINPDQRHRLAAIIAALHAAGPGSLRKGQ